MNTPTPRRAAKRFRIQFWVILLFYLVACCLPFILIFGICLGPDFLMTLVIVASSLQVYGFVVSIITWLACPVVTDDQRLKYCDSFGWRRLPWSVEIESIRERWIMGFAFVEIRTKKGNCIRLPGQALLADSVGFRDAVNEYAGPDHPLSCWLRTNWLDAEL
ncbi:MAG: hypothetical protein ACRC8S_13425 [Fimbriiglobus sp.]